MTRPLARATDPGTSHAATPKRERLEEQKRAILWLFENVGPMTDHELIWHYKRLRAQHGWPATQLDGVRKRRSDLKSEGRVYNTGSVAGFGGSPASIIWAATRTEATPR